MESLAEKRLKKRGGEKKNSPKSDASYKNLKNLPNFNKLSKGDKRFLQTFYPKRHICRSALRLGKIFACSRSSANETLDSWIKKEWISKENNYHTDKNGNKGKAFRSNYYCVIAKGEKHLKDLLNFLFENYQKKTNHTDRISKYFYTRQQYITNVIKNKPGGGQSPTSSLSLEEKKIFLVALDHSLNKLDKLANSILGKEKSTTLKKKKISLIDSRARDSFRETEKFRAIQEIFTTFGFKKMLNSAYRGTLLRLLTLPLDYIKKLLKLMKHKIKKGWKLQSFWGFFMSEVRKLPDKRRFADPWFKMLSKEYRDASDGKRNKLNQGVDSSIIVQGISKLERETGEKASEKVLEQFLYHGTQKFKSTIDAICYRMSLGIGDLPKEKAQEEDIEKPKSRSIFKQIKVNLETKKPYTTEDLLADKPFAMVSKIVGHEPIKEKPKEKEPHSKKRALKKINSWIGMAFFALKLGNPSVIHKAFFEKREKVA